MKRFLLVLFPISCLFCSFAIAQSNQTVSNGASTTAVTFMGAGCVYQWTNSNPSIGLPASGTGNIASFKAVNNGTAPVTATITALPQPVDFAYITNNGSNTVSVINTLSNTVVATIPVDDHPYGITVSPNGRYVYVFSRAVNTVSVIDAATNTVVNSISLQSLGTNIYTNGAAISPDGNSLYVSVDRSFSPLNDFVTVINTVTGKITASIEVLKAPAGICVSPDGSRVFVASEGANAITVIDAGTNQVVSSIQSGLGPTGIAITHTGNFLYVTNNGSTTVTVINAATGATVKTITVGKDPVGITISADDSKAYTANEGTGDVSVIDTKTLSATATIPLQVTYLLYGISITPDGKEVYVTCEANNSVTVINAVNNTVKSSVNVGLGPVSFGNFITSGLGCTGSPVSFTITVEPAAPPPFITYYAGALASLTTTYGTPSASARFTLSAVNLQSGILVMPPAGFEVSTDDINFTKTVIAGAAGTLAATTVYMRLAATTAVGTYSGNINLSSTGATDTNFAMDDSEVTPAILALKADDVNKTYGATLTGGPGLTNFTSTGLQNSETIGSVTVAYGAGAAATDPVNTYTGSVVISSATGGTFSPANYSINYIPGDIILTPTPLIVTVDNKSKVFGTVNPVFTISYSGFVNNETASVFTADPVITTTALTTSPAGQYPITASGAEAQNYTITYIPGVLTITIPAQQVIVPNAFTPNGDGINDLWDIKYLNLYPKCTVSVYTRYGEKVYSSVGYGVAWDGTYKGAPLPTGTYYYVIDPQSGLKIMSGYITIIR